MDIFLKTSAGVILALILMLTLSKQGKDISLLLTIIVCAMVAGLAITYLSPVVDFLSRLQTIGNLDSQMFSVLLKAVGIGLIAELVNLICSDAGNASLGKGLQLLSTAVILRLSIPLFDELIELLDTILGAI